MSHFFFSSVALKSIVGALVVAVGAVGVHGSISEASRGTQVGEQHGSEQPQGGEHEVVSVKCRDSRDDGGHESGDDRGHDARDDGGSNGAPPTGLQQTVVVSLHATAFLRVSGSGEITAAATNTGCPPRKGDEIFLFQPGGKIVPTTTITAAACDWTGAFSVPGRFYPQHCSADHHR